MQFLKFAAMAAIWSALCGLAVRYLHIAPIVLFFVWAFGFVWATGFIVSGASSADHLTKIWLGSFAGMVVIGSAIFIFLS